MKRNQIIFVTIVSLVVLFTSCNYDDYADVEYPDQTIYMPAAKFEIYDITDVSDKAEVPTSGAPYRYYINKEANTLTIPLGIYRAGISDQGDVVIDIVAENDTIVQLVNQGKLNDTKVLSMQNFTVPNQVTVASGEELESFKLVVDLDFIKENLDAKFALGIKIDCTERKVNSDLNTTIILINSALLKL